MDPLRVVLLGRRKEGSITFSFFDKQRSESTTTKRERERERRERQRDRERRGEGEKGRRGEESEKREPEHVRQWSGFLSQMEEMESPDMRRAAKLASSSRPLGAVKVMTTAKSSVNLSKNFLSMSSSFLVKTTENRDWIEDCLEFSPWLTTTKSEMSWSVSSISVSVSPGMMVWNSSRKDRCRQTENIVSAYRGSWRGDEEKKWCQEKQDREDNKRREGGGRGIRDQGQRFGYRLTWEPCRS